MGLGPVLYQGLVTPEQNKMLFYLIFPKVKKLYIQLYVAGITGSKAVAGITGR